jgi:hypothetical protein
MKYPTMRFVFDRKKVATKTTVLYFKFVLALTTKKESVRCIL